MPFVWALVFAILSYALSPKPPKPKNAVQQDGGEIPLADSAKPIPVAFGTVKVKAANTVWYGYPNTIPIKEDIKKK